MCKGVTKAISSGTKFQVEWDEDDQPIGPHAAELVSYIGTSVKRLVAITYADWRLVPDSLKDMVWKSVLIGFILHEQKKRWLLKVANNLWKRFKLDLTIIHMFDKDGDLYVSPPDNYIEFITPDQWSKFIEVRMSPDFKKLSDEHRELSLKNEYGYRASRGGYAGIKRKMKKDLGTANISRADVWKRARIKKNGEFSPKIKEVVDKMEILSEQASLGEIEISERQDILSMALEREEHPGRVRGVGQYVTITEYFGHASRGSSTLEVVVSRAVKESEESMEEKIKEVQRQHTNAHAQILEMQEFIVTLLQKMNKDMPQLSITVPQFGDQVPKVPTIPTEEPFVPPYTSVNSNEEAQTKMVKERVGTNMSASHLSSKLVSPTILPSSTPPSPMCNSLNEDFVPCTLFWPTMGQKVAIGSACCATSGVKLHHHALDPGCYKVQVVTPMQGKGDVKLPRPTDEAHTIFEAVGGFVAWPIELVSTNMVSEKSQKATSTLKTNPKVVRNESIINLSTDIDMVDSYTSRMPNFFWYHRAMGNKTHNIKLSSSIMGYEHTIAVGKSDIGQLLEQKKLTAVHTSIYMKYLWDKHCQNVDHMYGFLCPSSVSPGGCYKILTYRQRYIAKSISGDIEMKMILAPYNFGSDWILLAINVKDDTVYYLDPLRRQVPSDIQIFVDTSLRIFWADKGRKKSRKQTRWVTIKCPRQTDKDDSGYYVLRFMREIIDKRHTLLIPEEYYTYQATYTQEENDQIRVEWMEFFCEISDN